MENLINMIKKANRSLEKVHKWFRDNEENFGYTNYKLYAVSDYIWRQAEQNYPLTCGEYNTDNLFTWFCEQEYDFFTEWIKEEGLEYNPEYIRQTSSFKVHKDVIFYRDNIDIQTTLNTLLYEIDNYTSVDFDEQGYINIPTVIKTLENTDPLYYEDYIEDYRNISEYIYKGSFFEDIKKHFADSLKVREYIDDFKKRQVDIFKEYLSCYEEDIKAQQEKENREEAIEDFQRRAWLSTFSYEKEEVLEATHLDSRMLEKLALAH